MIVLQSDLDEAIGALISSGIDIFKEDYVVVASKDVSFIGVASTIPILIKDYCPTGAFYLVKRKDLEG